MQCFTELDTSLIRFNIPFISVYYRLESVINSFKAFYLVSGEFVFPGTGVGGYIIEPRKQIAKVIATSGISFSVHDLKRTFITMAESLDIPACALKRLLNHKMSSDITAGYIVADVERLRKPMQLIADFLLKSMGVKKSSEIIELSSKTDNIVDIAHAHQLK